MYSLKTLRFSNCMRQLAVRRFFLGHEDDAAGVAVEAVDDAGAIIAVEVAQLAEVELQGVDQRAAPVALGGMDDHVERLVDDGQELVLVEDVERNVFRHGQIVSGFRQPDANLIAGRAPCSWPWRDCR